eukprot:CAMPEP_0185836022 /NCGR_PEP_ID=MMETSP1353-20130828/8946_1 /TAXON_ID=1077150 /ORGANISM="Erythrolobus australicus, Strain CCMP3124" /LENGTH=75 /DNA_ID=CAMNT_0028534755 /DNA_START=34 /DNA_END=258 /DNA_ORIENTATION=+
MTAVFADLVIAERRGRPDDDDSDAECMSHYLSWRSKSRRVDHCATGPASSHSDDESRAERGALRVLSGGTDAQMV